MKDPSPASAGTVKPLRLIDPVRLRLRLQAIAAKRHYDPIQRELSEIATDVIRAMDRRQPGATQTGFQIVKRWRSRSRYLAELYATRPTYPTYYRSSEPTPQPARTRNNVGCKSTPTLPRSRSREQSHAARRTARSTPKAASRSGDSGDSSDPPGPSPAALAALLLFLLRGVDS